MTQPMAVIFMGVSGSGKTTAAQAFAQRMGWAFAEADEFHPQANIDKMSAGIPLQDEDRWPWLRDIRDWISAKGEAGENVVLTCSALKRSYRDLLREAECDVRFVLLDVDYEVLTERMRSRKGHYMPVSLLDSQLATLERLTADEPGETINAESTPESIVDQVIADMNLAKPSRL
ncbi:gluconokinase [Halotalea alkalilenta]|nr:gluconokinase [Halotalea alkalilenta]